MVYSRYDLYLKKSSSQDIIIKGQNHITQDTRYAVLSRGVSRGLRHMVSTHLVSVLARRGWTCDGRSHHATSCRITGKLKTRVTIRYLPYDTHDESVQICSTSYTSLPNDTCIERASRQHTDSESEILETQRIATQQLPNRGI